MRFLTVLLCAILSAPSLAAAATATLTFDAVKSGLNNTCDATDTPNPAYLGNTYVEQGFFADMVGPNLVSPCPLYWGIPGTIHLDDEGTPIGNSVAFSSGGRFTVHALDVISGGIQSPIFDPATGTYNFNAYDNVLFQGFRNGQLVASLAYSTGATAGTIWNVTFGAAFANLDQFIVTQVKPNASTFCSPCGHVHLDNLQISPIPLPAALWLMSAALLGVSLPNLARRNRRTWGPQL